MGISSFHSFSDFIDSKVKSFKNSLDSFKLDLNEDYSNLIKTEDFITESAASDRLDISILAADKYINSDAKIKWFLNTPVTIEAKTDGVKVTALKIDELKAKESSLTYSKLYSGTSEYSLKWDIGQDIHISKYFGSEIANGTAGSNGIYGNYKDLSSFNTIEFKLYSPIQTNSGYGISIRTKGGINGTYNGIIDWKGWKTLSLN
mgnify:CR=1 FL=1